MELNVDVLVVGGGPAGLAAACRAKEAGAKEVLVIERDCEPGGILNQCIHNGFGLHYFKEELTGPEYAGRFIKKATGLGVKFALDTMALAVKGRTVYAVNTADGILAAHAGAVVLAMGCRERTRGAIAIPGDRPAGVLTAGTAQRYINMEGYMVGRRVVVLGSGDIGLIMARRMTLEGAKVLACIEICPYSNGLTRNIVQCLNDYDIPLHLGHTIVNIVGKQRVEKVIVAKVDENKKPIPGSEFQIECDTVLLSVGLIPENELTKAADIALDPKTGGALVYEDMQTEAAGVFSCGNVVHVHDLVDFVTAESERAGEAAAKYALGQSQAERGGQSLAIVAGGGVTYTVPQRVRLPFSGDSVPVFFRVNGVYSDREIAVRDKSKTLLTVKRAHLAPGEMERIVLTKALLAAAEGGEITVELH